MLVTHNPNPVVHNTEAGELRGSPMTCLNGRSVLVVEDEYYLADDLARALENAGAKVVGPVGTIEEAQETLDRGGFDSAVVDMNLRGRSGEPIATRLSAVGVPFLVTTGYGGSSLPENFKNLSVLQKPFGTCEAVDRLAEIVAASPNARR